MQSLQFSGLNTINNFRQDIRMKKSIRVLGVMMLVLVACTKKDSVKVPVASKAYLSITHAAPFVQTLQLYMDHQPVRLSDSLRFGTTTVHTSLKNPYVPVAQGPRQVDLGFSKDDFPALSLNEHFAAGKMYSLFILDTLKYGRLKYLLIKDDFKKMMPAQQAALRFLNLSPNAPALDLYIVPWRKTDTVRVASNRQYPAYDFNNIYADNQFFYITEGDYWMEARIAGTGTVLLQGGLTVEAGSVFTLFTKGIYGAFGAYRLNVGVIEYIPE